MQTIRLLILVLACLAARPVFSALTVNSVITNGLSEPFSVAAATNDICFITDTANHRILKYSPLSGVLTNFAGLIRNPGTSDGTNYFARFNSPKGILHVHAGNFLVVADTGNHLLRKVSLQGVATRLAGSGRGYWDGPAATARFNTPIGLAADAAGNLFIADTKNNAIRRLDTSGNVGTVSADFSEPVGVAVSDDGRRIFVADTLAHTIKLINTDWTTFTNVTRIAGSAEGISGANDSIFGVETLFSSPRGLLWVDDSTGLLVCDTGNQGIRRVFSNPDLAGIPGAEYSVETYAGVLSQPGFVNGPAEVAKFNAPVWLALDSGGYLVADVTNNALRRIELANANTAVQVSAPDIGYVLYPKDPAGIPRSQLQRVNSNYKIFYNDDVPDEEVKIAVLDTDLNRVITILTVGPTYIDVTNAVGDVDSIYNVENIPSPELGGNPANEYRDGWPKSHPLATQILPQQDVTIKARSFADGDGRLPSTITRARFRFVVATPQILGFNAASFQVTNETRGAEMWYTLDGTEPSIHGPGSTNIVAGITVSFLDWPSNRVFKVKGFKKNYQDSETQSAEFKVENFEMNNITFGFESGEASTKFMAAPGQIFNAPVTLSLLGGQKMYTLQFNLSVTNADPGVPAVATNGVLHFNSMLVKEKPRTDEMEPLDYIPIIPAMATNYIFGKTNLTNLLITNLSSRLLMVGWIEARSPDRTNLYNTKEQDLITFSRAHDALYYSSAGKVIVGSFCFTVPSAAKMGDTYQIRIGRPSATDDGISHNVFIDSPPANPTNTPSATNVVTVGATNYIVGDVAPFRWLNAGDFGDRELLNNDVLQIFRSAVYRTVNHKPSDFFDAMDASDGTQTTVQDGNDRTIDSITERDGVLALDDVFVVYRRSLDPTLKWYARYWTNGVLTNMVVPNLFRGRPMLPAETVVRARATAVSSDPPSASFYADDFQVVPGQLVEVPIRVKVLGNFPLRALMLNVAVRPLDDSPALTQSVQFFPDSALGQPFSTSSQGDNYAAVWLNTSVDGVLGQGLIGTLVFTVPASADANAAYRIEFDHVSSSPNGLAIFPQRLQAGLVTLRDRMICSRGDGIPDAWRLRFFGSVTNRLAEAMADADGDGAPNWSEFRAGTSPTDFRSLLRMLAGGTKPYLNNPQQPVFPVLRWPSIEGKKYILEVSPALAVPQWGSISSEILGTGGDMEYTDTQANSRTRFYRVRLSE